MFLKYLIVGCVFLIPAGCTASDNAVQPGFIEGHLKISSLTPVELAEENTAERNAQAYAQHPLIILSEEGRKEIARVTADGDGNYRVALPPGIYILDVQDRAAGRVSTKPQQFTIVSKQTVRVDMVTGTDVRMQ